MIREAIRKKIIVFGAGYQGEKLANLRELRIDFFVDNDEKKQGKYIGPFPILSPKDLIVEFTKEHLILIANEKYSQEIAEQLICMGYCKTKDFWEYEYYHTKILDLGCEKTDICKSIIDKDNIWDIDDIFMEAEKRRKEIIFEISPNCLNVFSEDELYQLKLFCAKIICKYGWNDYRTLALMSGFDGGVKKLLYYQEKLERFKNKCSRLYLSQTFENEYDKGSKANYKVNGKYILITGWYGTETVGDKAILGGIFDELAVRYTDYAVKVTSIYSFITKRTIAELEIQAEVVDIYDPDIKEIVANAEIVIMGGGPLMDMDLLSIPLYLFSVAKQRGKRTIVWGCGIGPIHSDIGGQAIAEILKLADEITLRDNDSLRLAKKITERNDIITIPEPAIRFIRKINTKCITRKDDRKILACFLRDFTFEYRNGKTYEEFCYFKKEFEKALARNIKKACEKYDLIPRFYSMHNFTIGNDDRDFNYRFVEQYFGGDKSIVENGLSTIENVIISMKSAEKVLCMRFHSMIFAYTLNTDYCVIDYTSGGKILGFAKDNNVQNKICNMEQLLEDDNVVLHKYNI